MVEATITRLVECIGLYLFAGLVFAIPFATRGCQVFDPATRGSSWGFRLLLIPGSLLMWPWLALQWWKKRGVLDQEPAS